MYAWLRIGELPVLHRLPLAFEQRALPVRARVRVAKRRMLRAACMRVWLLGHLDGVVEASDRSKAGLFQVPVPTDIETVVTVTVWANNSSEGEGAEAASRVRPSRPRTAAPWS